LLIEDKIGAALQPGQGPRYRKRGQLGVPGSWDCFFTCIVAPRRYIERTDPGDWDARVALEDLLDWDWLQDAADPQRADFKRAVLKAAIDKERHSGALLVDPAVTAFRHGYFTLLQREFPELRMNPPKDSYAGETWFRLKHPVLPPPVWIHHKAERGFVDLCLPDVKEADLWRARDCFDEGMQAVQTGRSASLRLTIPKVESFVDFPSQELAVREGMAAAMRLCQFYERHGGRLAEALAKSRTRYDGGAAARCGGGQSLALGTSIGQHGR
jgi:hypothetical protein